MASEEDILKELREASLEHKAILQAHERDIHRIADSMKSIDQSIKQMTEFQMKQAVRDEKFSAQIADVLKTAERAHRRLDEHDTVFKRLLWLLITPVIIALLSTVIYKEANQVKLNQKLDKIDRQMQERGR